MSFDKQKIAELYPGAENLMLEAQLIWKLPPGKENMFEEVCESGEYFLTEKIDGALYQFVKTDDNAYLFGRTISKTTGLLTEKLDNVPHIKEALSVLPPTTVLIGEIYYPGGTSKNVTSIMGCLPKKAIERQKNNLIHYYAHDIIFCDGKDLTGVGAEDRYNILASLWEKYNLDSYDFLRLAEKKDSDFPAILANILASGGEGIVLKKKNAIYTPGKRPAWSSIKVKTVDTIDLVCTGLCKPTKEYTGKELETWSYWAKGEELANENKYGEEGWEPITKPYYLGVITSMEIGVYDKQGGNLIKIGTVSSGFTDADRVEMTYYPENFIGHVFEFSCMSIDKKEHTLRHPVYVGRRDDKNPQECTIEAVFN
jgi:ATP-dependent DNA ligase